MYNKLVYIFLVVFLSSQGLSSQVTIGSAVEPNEGTLLDLKQYATADGSANSTKGIGLPRVALIAIDDLSPCADNTSESRLSHIGLTVYNITDNADGDQTLKEGLYFWDGDLWQPTGLKAMQGFGPWYQVDNPTLPSRNVDTDSYLNAKAVIGGTDINNEATLSVYGSTIIKGDVTTVVDEPSAILNLQSSNKGLLLPKVYLTSLSDATTIPNPAKGLVVYNTNDQLIKGEGFYANYGDRTNPNWVAMGYYEPNDPNRYEIGDFVTAMASDAVLGDATNSGSQNNIPLGIALTISLDPMTTNKMVLTYSVPAGTRINATGYKGYIGIRTLRSINGASVTELDAGSRKYSISPLDAIFMTTIGATVVDVIENNTTSPMTVTYKLEGYLEQLSGSANLQVIYNQWKKDQMLGHEQNYNWGIGTMTIQTYYQLKKD